MYFCGAQYKMNDVAWTGLNKHNVDMEFKVFYGSLNHLNGAVYRILISTSDSLTLPCCNSATALK